MLFDGADRGPDAHRDGFARPVGWIAGDAGSSTQAGGGGELVEEHGTLRSGPFGPAQIRIGFRVFKIAVEFGQSPTVGPSGRLIEDRTKPPADRARGRATAGLDEINSRYRLPRSRYEQREIV